ncbi:hypothetical protein Tco_0065828 [Tanacetum coccineum]
MDYPEFYKELEAEFFRAGAKLMGIQLIQLELRLGKVPSRSFKPMKSAEILWQFWASSSFKIFKEEKVNKLLLALSLAIEYTLMLSYPVEQCILHSDIDSHVMLSKFSGIYELITFLVSWLGKLIRLDFAQKFVLCVLGWAVDKVGDKIHKIRKSHGGLLIIAGGLPSGGGLTGYYTLDSIHYIDSIFNAQPISGQLVHKVVLQYAWTRIDIHNGDNSPDMHPQHDEAETVHNMSAENKLYFQAEKEAIFLLLTGIGDEIYSTVDACNTTNEMWIAIERLQQGESLNVQDVKTNLFWEFGKFTSRDGESMESYYSRFYKLMNELTSNNFCQAINRDRHTSHHTLFDISDWLADTDEEIDEQELEAHYSFMARIQEVLPEECSSTVQPLEQVQNHDENNVFANERRHSEE